MFRTYCKRMITMLLVVIMMVAVLSGCRRPKQELTPPNDVTLPTDNITISADVNENVVVYVNEPTC